MVKITDFKDLRKYFNLDDDIIDFMTSLNKDTEIKKYVFSDLCYVNVQICETDTPTERMEAHEKFVDIQCLIDGEEKIYYTDKGPLTVCRPYDETRDNALYVFDKHSDFVIYRSGEGIILYPEEAHTPNRAANEPRTIKKAVIKVHVSLIK